MSRGGTGSVHRKPWHQFRHDDRNYVINIGDMRAAVIDDDLARLLARLADEPGITLDASRTGQLARLGLLAEAAPAQAAAGKQVPAPPVTNVALFLTQSCNLCCVYCYGDGGGYGTGGVMTEQTARRTVDWLIEQSGRMKRIRLGFFGGEPFLNFPLLRTVVAYATRRARETGKEIEFHATTNGTLLSDDSIAFLAEHAVRVTVSFDGPRDVQDAQRPFADGSGSYAAIVPGLRKLLTVLPETGGHAVLTGTNDPRRIREAMQDIGFRAITIVPSSVPLHPGAGTALPPRDMTALFRHFAEEAALWGTLIRNRDSDALRKLKATGLLRTAVTALVQQKRQYHACGAGREMVGVSCTGDVYLCHRFVGQDGYKLGNVFDGELAREQYGRSPATFVPACAACFARYHCAGGCKYENVSASGSPFVPSADICRLRCREFEMAAVVSSGLSADDRVFLAEHDIIPPRPCPLDF